MLNRLNDLSSRAAKILLNWLAVLVGMDLPPAMQTGLRTLAARHEKEVQVRWPASDGGAPLILTCARPHRWTRCAGEQAQHAG